MRARWEGSQLLADAEALAHWTGLNVATVRRHCQPVRRDELAGPGTGLVWYDLYASAIKLAPVTPRQRVAS